MQHSSDYFGAEADLGMFCMFGRTGAPTKGQKTYKLLQYSLTHLQFASERLASNCQLAAVAIVVCIAARVLNKMSTMTTVRVG